MIYSKLHQYIEGLDEIIKPDSSDFIQSGLRTGSVIRVTRIAVVAGDILMGTVGEVSPMKIPIRYTSFKGLFKCFRTNWQ